jgi:hypothetical protein
MLPITQIAINGVIYPEIQTITTNAQQNTFIAVGESLFVAWYMPNAIQVESMMALDATTVSLSCLFANNNWVNTIIATASVIIGEQARFTLSGASLGRIILGEWDPNDVDEFFGESMLVQFILQSPFPLFAPKVVATFY